ncbi:CaiB/BaiF CoA transferase family protein [Hydrogenophaga sp. BPS33]|uniref:CaiB/BaiF CoA transferase family protein n=1 Tax=Hydrogenophaga sp. BPS33 TaxID=2651974 RepID=UPI00131FF229|nr:CoA transferase [Hydrogenophaga sp. BPS33]QHE84318.1 CoA transferase [Hydrogenophaga sp. BPS33]
MNTASLPQLPLRDSTGALDLLKGVRVLDLTNSIAGPYAGQLLGDLGATVLKIEKPGSGDDVRAWGPPFLEGEALWYQSVNRNKLSLTLDFQKPAGYAILERLVKQCDVVVVNVVARVQTKLGIDHNTLTRLRPGLIHASLTGFGLDGERADMPCYDLIAEGYSGVMDLTGEPESAPQKVGTPAADMLAGHDCAMAILAALVRRSRSNEGCAIDIAMVESMTRFMAPRLMPYLGSGEAPRRSGGKDSVIAIYQTFDTADEPMTLGLGNDAIWKRFWAAVGDPAFGEDPAFATNAQRRAQRPRIVERITALLATQPRAVWLELLREARVPAGPISRVDQVTADAELQRRGMFYAVERDGCRVPQVGLGIRFDGRSEACSRLPPRLGEDNTEVLRDWLQLSAQNLDQLRADHVI